MGGMPLPKQITFVTFDVYGTLIDWETGIADAFKKAAAADGVSSNGTSCCRCSTRSSARSSRARTSSTPRSCAVPPWEIADAPRSGSSTPPSRRFLPDSIRTGSPSRRLRCSCASSARSSRPAWSRTSTTSSSVRRAATSRTTSISSSRRSRSAPTSRTPRTSRRSSAASARRRAWSTSGRRYYHDVEPCLKAKIPVIWLNRHDEELEGRKKPTEQVKTLLDAAKLLGL